MLFNKYPNLKSLNTFYKEYRLGFVFFVILAAAASGLSLAFPYASSRIILNLTGGDYTQTAIYSAVLLGLAVLNALVEFGAEYLYSKSTNGLFFSLRKSLAHKITNLRLSSVYDKGSGYFLERLNEDSREASVVFLDICRAIINLVVNLGFIFYITVLNYILGLMFAGGIAVIVVLEYLRVSKLLQNKKDGKHAVEKVKANEAELLKGLKEIKGLNAGEFVISKHSALSGKHIGIKQRRELYEKSMQRIIDVTKALLDFAIIILAALYLIPSMQIELLAVLVIYSYKGNVYELVAGVARIKNHYVNGELAAKRLNNILKAPEDESDSFGEAELNGKIESIEFKNVGFGYNADRPVLNDVSFCINKNSMVGFVGASGSGKSTIFSLLTNFYAASSGSILINGIPLSTLSKNALRNGITPVLQDPYIFYDTVMNNLKLVKPDASDEEVYAACAEAQIHNEIMQMPDGYNSMIGENGANLSGGQKQRLEIARAILKGSDVILFDEATSALDKNNMNKINSLMLELKKTRIVFVIAHRLGVMRLCDTVLVLDSGKIIANGTHAQLTDSSPYYRELFKRKSSNPDPQTEETTNA